MPQDQEGTEAAGLKPPVYHRDIAPDNPGCAYHPERSRQLLEEAGYPEGLDRPLIIPGLDNHRAVGEALTPCGGRGRLLGEELHRRGRHDGHEHSRYNTASISRAQPQTIRLTRDRHDHKTGAKTRELFSAITSLPAGQATSEQLAACIPGRWGIENRLHRLREATYREDSSQVRTGHGGHVLATIRDLTISILRLAGATNITKALRTAMAIR